MNDDNTLFSGQLVGKPSNLSAFFEQILFSVSRDENQASQGTLVADEHPSQAGRDFDQVSDTSMTTDFIFGRIDVPLSSDLFIISPAPDAKEEDLNFTENPFH